MISVPEAWTVIFSKTNTAWGSFTYDEAEDALRVTVKPAEGPMEEALTYFVRRRETQFGGGHVALGKACRAVSRRRFQRCGPCQDSRPHARRGAIQLAGMGRSGATAIYRNVAKRFPQHWLGHMARARVDVADGDFEGAIREIKAVALIIEDQPVLWAARTPRARLGLPAAPDSAALRLFDPRRTRCIDGVRRAGAQFPDAARAPVGLPTAVPNVVARSTRAGGAEARALAGVRGERGGSGSSPSKRSGSG
jgi:hypothetical protein